MDDGSDVAWETVVLMVIAAVDVFAADAAAACMETACVVMACAEAGEASAATGVAEAVLSSSRNWPKPVPGLA